MHLTDYRPQIVQKFLKVAAANNISNVKSWELDWNQFLEPGWSLPQHRQFDIVVAADCVYHHVPEAFTAAAVRCVLPFVLNVVCKIDDTDTCHPSVRLSEDSDSLRFLMMSQADRVGLPLVIARLKQIPNRNVYTKAFTFSQFETKLNLNKFPVALRRKAKDITLTYLEVERKTEA